MIHTAECKRNARMAIEENNLTIEDERDHTPASDADEWLANNNVACICGAR